MTHQVFYNPEANRRGMSVLFSAVAQDSKLIEQVKKEGGKVIGYGSLESFTVEPHCRSIERKTGITVEYWRASATKVMDRALSETRAGKTLFDVMLNNSGAMQVLKKEGISPDIIDPPPPFLKKSPTPISDRSTAICRLALFITRNCQPSDAPKSLEDLLNPKYRGKVVMPDPTQHIGRERHGIEPTSRQAEAKNKNDRRR